MAEDYNVHIKKHDREEEELRELKELLKKDIELSERILEMSEYIKNFVFWQKVFSVLKILLIVVPLVLGLIYLPPLIKKAFEPYQELLNIQREIRELPGFLQYLR
jgi:hypothetical protein